MPMKAKLRRTLYNTREWREQRGRVMARSFGRCECRGECGRLHAGDAGRCVELHGQQGLFQAGVVTLQVAHVAGARSGERVPDEKLRAYCARCHLWHDESAHLAARKTRRMAALEALGQIRLL